MLRCGEEFAMLRIIFGTLAGVAVAFVVLMAVDAVNHALYPPPKAVRVAAEKWDSPALQQAVRDWLPQAPPMALILIPVAWVAGSFWGALVGTWISRCKSYIPATIVGGLILVGTIMNLRAIPHPTWIALAGLIGVPAAAAAAWRLWPKPPAAGPQPYDMREKNMAC